MAGRGTDILLGGNPDFLARQELLREGMEESMVEEATGHADTDDEEILAARGRYADAYARYKADTSSAAALAVRETRAQRGSTYPWRTT